MKTEYEAKFVNISTSEIRQKLRSLGGSSEKPERLMRRVTIDSPEMKQNKGYLRVRDEGDCVETAEALGLSWGDAIFGDVMAAYRAQYPHLTPFDTIASIRNVTFDSPLPDMLKK